MSDVVPELLLMAPEHGRTIVCADRTSRQMNETIRRAAAEITRLRAQVASLTAAVEKIAKGTVVHLENGDTWPSPLGAKHAQEIAAAAIREGG